MKNSLKKILFIFVLIGLVFFTSGCVQVENNVKYYQDGYVQQEITLTLDKNLSATTIRKIQTYTEKFSDDMEERWKHNILELFSEELTSSSDIQNISDILQNHSAFTMGETEIVYSEIQHTIVFTKTYISVYDSETKSAKLDSNFLVDVPFSGNFEEDESTFYTKYLQTFSPLLYNGDEEPSFYYPHNVLGGINISAGDKLKDVFEKVFPEFSENQVDLIFSFSTPYHRVHSDGQVSLYNGYYKHSWNIENLTDTTSIWRNSANYVTWYLVALAISLMFIIVGLFGCGVIKSFFQKDKKEDEAKVERKVKNPNWIDRIR